MTNDKKAGRSVENNVDYFPHNCKDDKELIGIKPLPVFMKNITLYLPEKMRRKLNICLGGH